MVDEDKYSTYSSLILKYYLAEAITNKHKTFLASANQPPSQIIQVGLHLHVYMGFCYVVNNQNQVNADPDANYVDPLIGEPLICDSGLQHIYYDQIALLIK